MVVSRLKYFVPDGLGSFRHMLALSPYSPFHGRLSKLALQGRGRWAGWPPEEPGMLHPLGVVGAGPPGRGYTVVLRVCSRLTLGAGKLELEYPWVPSPRARAFPVGVSTVSPSRVHTGPTGREGCKLISAHPPCPPLRLTVLLLENCS